jgi:serine protease Do
VLTIPVTVGDLPSNGSLDKPVVPDLNGYAQLGRPDLGLILAPLTDDARAKLAMSAQQPGVLVEDVVAHSVASDRGITAGSVIVSVERQSVTSSADVLRSLDDARQSNRRFVLLLVLDAQSLRWVPLPLG